MKIFQLFILASFCGLMINITCYSQTQNCENLSFELGNFTNWEGYTWQHSTKRVVVDTIPVAGIKDRRQTIISDVSAYDSLTGYSLKMIPPGYQYSARLGDATYVPYQEEGITRCWNQNLRYTMTIDSSNALLILKFALVLEYARSHTVIEEPRFRLTLLDQYGDTIPDCANYEVYASNEDVEGFEIYYPPGDNPVMWRDWTTVGVNLIDYLGQSITIDFLTADCNQTYHYGYAYFVAECSPLVITHRYCANDSIALFTAPQGFRVYDWKDSIGSIVGTSQVLAVNHPVEGSMYSCTMTSETHCTVSLNSTVARHAPAAIFTSRMLDCNSNTVQLNDFSTTNRGTLVHLWDFGDGNISYEASPQYTFTTSGRHKVNLSILNPPSICTSSLTRTVESFSPPLVGIDSYSTYCPGESVTLKAYGASTYEWNTGSSSDSIEVSAPGGYFSFIGRSSTGCADTNYISITEEPDWEFLTEGDTALCEGESSELTSSGAFSYLWNTGDTTNSIVVSKAGSFIITGANLRACKKSKTFNVIESPPPAVSFIVSANTLDTRHNELTANLSAQDNVQYDWDMGDGKTQMGSSIRHEYAINNAELAYTISLTATNEFDCINSRSQLIEVIPFVPNVFSPNGDGKNDIFMPDLELRIFDRNGILLYEGITGWDGRYNGRDADPDTYFYSIFYLNLQEEKQEKKGYLTLVR